MLKQMISALLCACLILTLAACTREEHHETEIPSSETAETTAAPTQTQETEPQETDGTLISLLETSARIEGSGASWEDGTVTISKEGTYILSGDLQGQILVDAKGAQVHLILNGAHITSASGPAVYIKKADLVTVTLADGTENSLCDSEAYDLAAGEDEPNACLYSKADIEMNGTGLLAVTALYDHGINCKDALTVIGPQLRVEAKGDGIRGKDSVTVLEADITVTAGGDGIQSSNTDAELGVVTVEGGSFTLTCGDDGIQAAGDLHINGGTFTIAAADDGIHADGTLYVRGGDVTITESYEGLEGAYIEISGGSVTLSARDDGINATGTNRGDALIHISGGSLEICAQGDGVDSNGAFRVDGGLLLVNGPTDSGNGALDYDQMGTVNGGTVLAVGSTGMAQGFNAGEQCSFAAVMPTMIPAGTELTITDSRGNVLLTYTAASAFQSVVFSSPEVQIGETYTVTAGAQSVTVEQTDTAVGNNGGFGGFGGKGDRFGNEGGRGDRFGNGDGPQGDFEPGQMPQGDFHPGEMPPGGFESGERPQPPEGGFGPA